MRVRRLPHAIVIKVLSKAERTIMQTPAAEYTLYLMYISYFSGKMQAYMRYKEIPHRCVELKWGEMVNILYPNTGLMKVPVVQTPEGQWLHDSTPMMD